MMFRWMNDVFPRGSCELTDPSARLSYMDRLGVDVQVLFPSWWLLYPVASPAVEAAMSRSYNRWMAAGTSNSGGRLRWAVHVPVRSVERAFQEMEFGKEHGAVSVFLLGQNHGMSLARSIDASPLREGPGPRPRDIGPCRWRSPAVAPSTRQRAAQRPDEGPRCFLRRGVGGPGQAVPPNSMGVSGSRCELAAIRAARDVPADESGVFRSFKDWHIGAAEVFSDQQLFIAAQMDDDLPYLLELTGPGHLVYGTDFGHLDLGSDPDGMQIVTSRADLGAITAREIVDENGRRLYGIDPSFQPAPPPSALSAVSSTDNR